MQLRKSTDDVVTWNPSCTIIYHVPIQGDYIVTNQYYLGRDWLLTLSLFCCTCTKTTKGYKYIYSLEIRNEFLSFLDCHLAYMLFCAVSMTY